MSSAYRFRRKQLSIILLKVFSFMLLKFNVFNLISQSHAPPTAQSQVTGFTVSLVCHCIRYTRMNGAYGPTSLLFLPPISLQMHWDHRFTNVYLLWALGMQTRVLKLTLQVPYPPSHPPASSVGSWGQLILSFF